MEQFEQSPIAIFSTRYNEILRNGGNRWVSVTQSLNKANGKWIYDSGPKAINGASPMFFAYHMDMKARTINLIGFSGTVQHYIDDSKAAANRPLGAISFDKVPRAFFWDYTFPPEPGKRIWTRSNESTFIERYPSGKESKFRILGPANVANVDGILLQLENTGMQAFIPYKGTPRMELKLRAKESEAWRYLGLMQSVQ
jgi:hypothetical protein